MHHLDTLIAAKAKTDAAYLEHIREARDAYRLAIAAFANAEVQRLTDPLSDEREQAAKDARADLATAQAEFDSKVKGGKATRTREWNAAWADAVKAG